MLLGEFNGAGLFRRRFCDCFFVLIGARNKVNVFPHVPLSICSERCRDLRPYAAVTSPLKGASHDSAPDEVRQGEGKRTCMARGAAGARL